MMPTNHEWIALGDLWPSYGYRKFNSDATHDSLKSINGTLCNLHL